MTDLIDTKTVAALAGVKVDTIYHYKQWGYMPEPKTTFGRSPVWDRAEIEQWVREKESRKAQPTTENQESTTHG